MRRLIISLFSVAALSGCGAPLKPRPGAENPVVRLRRDIAKVDRAIEATKRLLALAHSAPYVPDLYMRLAELYAEQSRYQYLIAYESDPKKSRAIVSVPARLLKGQAVQLYDRVAREFPNYPDLDKAFFFKGHEQRELGSYEDMIATYEELVRRFPRSQYRHQALIVIGDYHFDRTSYPRAEEQYRKVLADPEGPQHAMARYKLAWARQNQEDCKAALGFFEAAARTKGQGITGRGAGERKLDLRREALVDSGYCFTEVRKPEEALPFYRGLAETRTVYIAALSRLARRYHAKGLYKAAAPLYREILESDPTHEDNLEFVQRLYEGLSKSPSAGTVERDVEIIARVAELRYFSPYTADDVRKAMLHDFEVYARDLATKAQLAAKESKDERLLAQVATAYERYLSFFRDVARAKEAEAIEANLADTLYEARRYIPAGRAYEAVAARKETGEAERKAALFSAAAAYTQALKGSLSNYEQVAARAGLYRAGRSYITLYPTAENLPELKFNIANSLYEEGNFREAIARFVSLAEQFPQTKEGQIAAQLALDSYRLRYDMEGLIRTGQRFMADNRLGEDVRKKVGDVVAMAQQRQLDVLTMTAGQSERGADTLVSFAKKNVGSALGEKALLSAFMAARDGQDLAKLVDIGDQLLQGYPRSTEIVGVLGTLGKLTAQAAQFDEASRYLDEAARREPGPRGQEMQRTAAVLRAQRGDRKGAEEGLRALLQGNAPPSLIGEAAQALGDLYRHTGDGPALIELARTLGDKAPPGLRLDAAVAALLGGAPLDRVAPDLRAIAASGDAAAAEARLYLIDLQRQQLEAIAFSDKRGEDAKVIARRFALQNQIEAQYLAVVKAGRPVLIIAALGRLAQLYAGGAQFLENAPVPPGLSADQAEKYKEAFRGKAQPLAKKAEDTLRTCGETAAQLRVFSAGARACVQGQQPPRYEPLPPPVPARPAQPEAPALRARLVKNPGDGDALVQLALLHLRAGDVHGAKLVADRAIETGGPALSAAHNLAGVLSYQLGEPAEAQRHLQEALRADRRNPRARLSLANLYREYGYAKSVAAEVGGLSDIPPEIARDPAVIPAPAAEPTVPAPAAPGAAPVNVQEKK
jgi:tetratricopeptide (TPR) repeat protein